MPHTLPQSLSTVDDGKISQEPHKRNQNKILNHRQLTTTNKVKQLVLQLHHCQ